LNALFRILVGIGGGELRAASDARRICRGFPAADAGTIDGERKKDVVTTQDVVIEKVYGRQFF
jgi:hypothetical protein